MWLVWWLNNSRRTNGASFSLSQRTLHFSWSSSAKCTILSRLAVEPCSAGSGNNIAPTHKETRSPSLETDVRKILSLTMLGFCQVVMLIPETTKVHAAHGEVCIEIGFSPSLPSSASHQMELSVATSVWLHNVPRTFPVVSFHSLPVASGRSHAPSMVRRANF